MLVKNTKKSNSIMRLALSTVFLAGASQAALMVAAGDAMAQEQAQAIIAGRVIDRASGIGLSGARISVEGQDRSVYSSDGGFFELSVEGGGEFTLKVEFLGYPTERTDVNVEPGGVAEVRLELGVTEVDDEIIVTARVSDLNKGLSQERASEALVSVAAADVIGQFPDRNIAETLQRVSGVTIRSQTGEGSFAVLRGILPQLSTTTINNQRLQSVQSEGRENRLGYIGSATVERIEVEKVFTPDMSGDFIGGNINIVTKGALDIEGAFLAGSVEGGSIQLADDNYFEFEATAANSFFDNNLGILVSFNYSDRAQQTEGVVSGLASNSRIDPSEIDLLTVFGIDPDPTTINAPASSSSFTLPVDVALAQNELTAERISGAFDIDFRPNGRQRYRVIGTMTKLEETRLLQNAMLANGLLVGASGFGAATGALFEAFRGPQETPTFHAATPIIFAQNQPREVFTGSLAFITEQKFGEFDVDAAISYGWGDIESTNFQLGSGFILDGSSVGPFQFGYDFTDIVFPGLVTPAAVDPVLADPASYNLLFEAKRRSQEGFEDEVIGRFNLARAISINTRPAELKFGFFGATKSKRTDVDTIQYVTALNAAQGAPAAALPVVPAGLLAAAYDGNVQLNSSLAGGRYAFGPFADVDAGEEWLLANFSAGIKPDQSTFESALRDFTATENVYAGYGRLKFEPFSHVEVIAGARVESYKTEINSFSGVFGDDSVLVSSSNTNTLVLPSLVMRADPSDDIVVRAGVTRTYARPTFEQLAPRAQFNPLNGSVGGVGNPDLKPITSINYDLSVDYYTRPLGVIRAGFYYKDLSDIVVNVQRTLSIDETFRGVAPPTGTAWTIDTLDNASDGWIYGFEVGLQRSFTGLPGFLKGLGISGNYLYTQSEASIADNTGAFVRSSPLELASEHSGNVSLLYDLAGVKARLAFRYQGDALFRLGSTAELDRFFDDRRQLDFTIQFAPTDNFAIFFEAFNLTDAPFRTYQGSEEVHKESQLQGRQFGGGIRFQF